MVIYMRTESISLLRPYIEVQRSNELELRVIFDGIKTLSEELISRYKLREQDFHLQ
jgi:hypothetical protein